MNSGKEKVRINEEDLSSLLSRQAELFRHNQAQAQRFLRAIIAVLAISGVSATLTVITSWGELKSILPNRSKVVHQYPNVSTDLINITVKYNWWVAFFALLMAVFLISISLYRIWLVLQSEPLTPVLGKPPVKKEVEVTSDNNCLEKRVEENQEILAKQKANLDLGYKTGFFGGLVASCAAILMGFIATNSADFLAIANILVTFITIAFFLEYVPIYLTHLLIDLSNIVKRILGHGESVTIEELRENYKQNVLFLPSVASVQVLLYFWFLGFSLSSMFGLIWWGGVFVNVIELGIPRTVSIFMITVEIPYVKAILSGIGVIFIYQMYTTAKSRGVRLTKPLVKGKRFIMYLRFSAVSSEEQKKRD